MKPMADIQYQAYLAKLFKDKQNTQKNLHTLFTLSFVRIANKSQWNA